jgi:dihydroxy-acid dehydratase
VRAAAYHRREENVTTVEDRPTGSETADVKPRSREVTDGITKAPARAMLRAVGMGDDDWDKPQIGVASSWNEITPCNLSLDRLAKRAKEGVRRRRLPAGVRHDLGLRRHLDGPRGHARLAGLPRGHRRLGRDGHVRRAARRLGAAGRLRQVAARHAHGRRPARPASVFLYAGSTLPGQARRPGDLTIIDVFEGVGACAAGLITRDELTAIEKAACPGRAPAAACTPPTPWPASPRRSA